MFKLEKIFEKAIKQLKINEKDFIGLFLYGSQNYGLSQENSDYDFICLTYTADKIFDIVHFDFGQVKIYTLDYFKHLLVQGDLECSEVLFSPYYRTNSEYDEDLNNLRAAIKLFGKEERLKASLKRKLKEHIDFLDFKFKGDTGYYNKKRLYWALRVKIQLELMQAGSSFEQSLICPEALADSLIKIKTINSFLSPAEYLNKKEELTTFLVNLPSFESQITRKELETIVKHITDLKNRRCALA